MPIILAHGTGHEEEMENIRQSAEQTGDRFHRDERQQLLAEENEVELDHQHRGDKVRLEANAQTGNQTDYGWKDDRGKNARIRRATAPAQPPQEEKRHIQKNKDMFSLAKVQAQEKIESQQRQNERYRIRCLARLALVKQKRRRACNRI